MIASRYSYRDAHERPLVSRGRQRDGSFGPSFRVAPGAAWSYPLLELRAANSWPVLVLDLDADEDEDAREAVERLVAALVARTVPAPNWMVTRRATGGTHVVWCLARAVHRGAAARAKPMMRYGRVAEYYAQVLRADEGYVGVLSHNPMARAHGPDLITTWGRRAPYDLDALAEVIPFGWRRPCVARTAIGRNCDLFRGLMRWAGSPANERNDVLAAALAANQDFGLPLGYGEVAGIARSVERYRDGWIAQGCYFSADESEAWGRRYGRRSGAVRRRKTADRDARIVQAAIDGESGAQIAARPELSEGLRERTIRHIVMRDAPLFADGAERPWEAAGVARRTWYRRLMSP